jgi:hypothetical protein
MTLIQEQQLRLGQSEDACLRRTIYIADLPMSLSGTSIEVELIQYGSVSRTVLDIIETGKFALVEFDDESAATDAVNAEYLWMNGTRYSISRAMRTATVYAPFDVVFGKPTAVGRHVMASNPIRVTHSVISRRQQSLKKVESEIKKTFKRLQIPGL